MKKNKGIVVIILILALVLGLGVYCVDILNSTTAKKDSGLILGLDLSGGVSITYKIVNENPSATDIADTIAKMEERAENYSTEYAVYQVGEDRITVEIPGVFDANAVLEELGSPGALYFIVQKNAEGKDNYSYDSDSEEEVPYKLNFTIEELIKDKRLLLIDDSIVRGTQLRETAEYLYSAGAKEVHVRPACPPIMFRCKYLNFSRSTSEMDLITWQVISKLENTKELTKEQVLPYCDSESEKYHLMIEEIRKKMGFDSLQYYRTNDLIEAIGLKPCQLCTYCFTGKED